MYQQPQNKNLYKKSSTKGFSIIEVILAGSILALIVFGIVSAWLYGEHALIKSGDTGRGVAIASEGIEIMRNLRDFDYTLLQDGTYALTNNGSGWTLLPNEKEAIGVYKRYLTIMSDGASKRNITSTVEWTNVDGSPGVISSSTVLTNWRQVTKKVTKSSALAISDVLANPTETTAYITWTTNKPATSDVQYGTTASYGSSPNVIDTAPMVTSHSYEVTGLARDTVYHYRVTSVDATGTQAYSIDATFRTEADNTLPVISNIAVNPGSNSAIITWDTDEVASSYIEWGLDETMGNTTEIIDTSPYVTSHQVTLPSLAPGTQYYFKVYSADPTGNLGTASQDRFTTTTEAIVITDVSVAQTSATYFTITWTTNIEGDSRIISGNGDFSDVVIDESPMVTSHEVTVSGLNPCTPYTRLTVTSYDTYGGSDSYEMRDGITTKGCPPSVMSNFSPSMSDINTVSVRPDESGDTHAYVYGLNTRGDNSPQLGAFSVKSNGTIEFENYKYSNDFADFGVSTSYDMFVLRNYLYVTGTRDIPVAIFDIATDPSNPQYLAKYSEAIGDTPTSIFIKDMMIDGENATMMYLGYQGAVSIFRMTPHMDEGSPALPGSPLADPSQWAEVGHITLPGSKDVPYDIYVSDPDHGVQSVYVNGYGNVYHYTVSAGNYSGEFNSSSYTAIDYPMQLTARESTNSVIFTGGQNPARIVLGSLDYLNFDHAEFAKSFSFTYPTEPYLFANTDSSGKEFRIISMNEGGDTTYIDGLDLSGTFDGSYYGQSLGSTIAYLNFNHYIFYSKWDKILMIDPSI